MYTLIRSLTRNVMAIYTGPATCGSINAQAIAGYLSIPEVSTVYCFCFTVKKFCGFIYLSSFPEKLL